VHALRRVTFTAAIAVSIVIAAVPGFANAQQKFPSKPIRIVTSGAGSQNDLLARIMGPKLSELMGQPIVIENRPGAGALPFIKDGRLMALAVANHRIPLLPDVPAMTEALPTFERSPWFGLLAPTGTPRPILNQFSREVRRVLEQPEIKERLQSMGFTPLPNTPEEFDRIVRTDIETFKKMAKAAGLIAK
jgi:tripartite-type tricarboxylate transporter receptor subunit TctC